MMLQTKYQGSRPCGFREELFCMFSSYKPIQTCEQVGPYWLNGHILYKFGTGLLGDATYKISDYRPCGV